MKTAIIMNGAYLQVIYPKVLTTKGHDITVSTTLRMEHEGKWYLCNFIQSHSNPETPESILLDRLHKEVYKMQHIGKVGPDLVNIFEEKVFKLDDNQESEVERITKLAGKFEI